MRPWIPTAGIKNMSYGGPGKTIYPITTFPLLKKSNLCLTRTWTGTNRSLRFIPDSNGKRGQVYFTKGRLVMIKLTSRVYFITVAVYLLFSLTAYYQAVKNTPLGSHEGEFCVVTVPCCLKVRMARDWSLISAGQWSSMETASVSMDVKCNLELSSNKTRRRLTENGEH